MFSDFLFLLNQLDNTLKEVHKLYNQAVLCKKGCSDCCNAFFDVSLIEAIFILNSFKQLDDATQNTIINNSQKSNKESQKQQNLHPDKRRIRCPLLSENEDCMLYEARPVNCRVYGAPVSFGNISHVCGKSGFNEGIQYQTLKMDKIQGYLYDISVKIGGKSKADKRYTIYELIINNKNLFAEYQKKS
jgi:Fe-S-cluster containining protein